MRPTYTEATVGLTRQSERERTMVRNRGFEPESQARSAKAERLKTLCRIERA